MKTLKNLVYLLTFLSSSALAHPGHDGFGIAVQQWLLWTVLSVASMAGLVLLIRHFMHRNGAKDDG